MGCASLEHEAVDPFLLDYPSIDPVLKPFVEDFMVACHDYGPREGCYLNYRKIVSISMTDIIIPDKGSEPKEGANLIGVCRSRIIPSDFLLDQTIELLSSFKWNNDLMREVVYHEMGHAIGLAHSTVKESIMYPTISYGAATWDWGQKLKEMFKDYSNPNYPRTFEK